MFEVFGGAAPEVLSLLEGWARRALQNAPGVEPPWSAHNFMPYRYWSQLLSKEAQRGAAIEILNRVDGEAADREAAQAVRQRLSRSWEVTWRCVCVCRWLGRSFPPLIKFTVACARAQS